VEVVNELVVTDTRYIDDAKIHAIKVNMAVNPDVVVEFVIAPPSVVIIILLGSVPTVACSSLEKCRVNNSRALDAYTCTSMVFAAATAAATSSIVSVTTVVTTSSSSSSTVVIDAVAAVTITSCFTATI
jgi:hypothetical protein